MENKQTYKHKHKKRKAVDFMKITIRNITKDNMKDFRNDHTITLPMEESELKMFLGSDEWIIIDSTIGEELTNIMELNELLTEKDEEAIKIL